MPWLRGGTVAVTNGSTTVTGTNADFAANSRVGDAFIGPDGLNYEIGNVASATVISILPAYKGATASGAAYAIMPVNGYPKLLTDAFNNLNNQFGPVLAVLGPTGTATAVRASLGLGSAATESVVPIAKGGTGANDAASARSGLGLGALAVESVAPLAKGGTGATSLTAARAALGVRSGDVRWKSNASAVSIPSSAFTTINWNNDVYGTPVGVHSQASNNDAFVLPAGLYVISTTLTFDYAGAGRRGLRFTLDGNAFAGSQMLVPFTPNGTTTVTLTILLRVINNGSILRVQGYQDSGSALNAPLSGASNMEIYLLGDA
ncbi:hypothetical protein ACTACG_07445 [Pseudomonas syringae]|uniref:hypothetical protein n=1 Tax=Pseudomonas syringae TaxID=317 RepID=UPI003F74C107